MQGSKMFVDIDSDVKVEDLIRGMIIQSGNDACIVLAEGLAGSEEAFAERMNKKAKEHRPDRQQFHELDRLAGPQPLYDRASDLAILVDAADHATSPTTIRYFAEQEFTWHGIKQGNRNPLLYRTGLGRRRVEDRPYRRGGLRPDGIGDARRPAHHHGGAWLDRHAGARRRGGAAARLGVPRVRQLHGRHQGRGAGRGAGRGRRQQGRAADRVAGPAADAAARATARR